MMRESSKFEWRADVYHRVSSPQVAWGERVLDSLSLRGDEVVLDAGCGTGLVTALLLERIPHGRVVALDGSATMLDIARHNLARFGDRVDFVHGLLPRHPLPSGFDLVLSTATFHWVHDHATLFQNIHDALVPGGTLCAQCGGADNLKSARALIREVARREPYAPYFERFPDPWFFAGVDDTRRRLDAAGFREVAVWLEDAPTPFADAPSYTDFVRAVILPPFLVGVPEPLHARFAADLTARAALSNPPLTLDFLRLNVRAVSGRSLQSE